MNSKNEAKPHLNNVIKAHKYIKKLLSIIEAAYIYL